MVLKNDIKKEREKKKKFKPHVKLTLYHTNPYPCMPILIMVFDDVGVSVSSIKYDMISCVQQMVMLNKSDIMNHYNRLVNKKMFFFFI